MLTDSSIVSIRRSEDSTQTRGRSSAAQKRWGYLCCGLGIVLTIASFVALFAATNLPTPLWEPSVAPGAMMVH